MAKFSFEEISDAELIELYGSVMEEMRKRGIVRSANNPIADIAERIIADHYGVDPEPPNNKAYDVVAKDGTTIQVKALRRTKSSRRNLSPLRSLDFDYVAAVMSTCSRSGRFSFPVKRSSITCAGRKRGTRNAYPSPISSKRTPGSSGCQRTPW